jgi:anti-anti-sigma factor
MALGEFFQNTKGEMPSFIDSMEDYPHLKMIRLKGNLDKTTIGEMRYFRDKAKKHHELLNKNILLDFRNVEHVDSAAIAELLQILKELKQKNYKLALMYVSPTLKSMLQILNLDEVLEVFDTEKKAFTAILSWSKEWK